MFTNSTQVSSDVEVTFACKNDARDCLVQYDVTDWGCYGPPDVSTTYTRVNETGSCYYPSSCEERCAKSVSIGKLDNDLAFVSRLDSPCQCPVLTVTPSADGKTASNNDTNPMNVTFGTNAMTVAFGNNCTYSYKLGTFTTAFTNKHLFRKSVTPRQCVQPTECNYQCEAEFNMSRIEMDMLVATPANRTNCSCEAVYAVVKDDGASAQGYALSWPYSLMVDATSFRVNRTNSNGTCLMEYQERKICGAGCTEKSVIAGGSAILSKPTNKTCAAGSFAYPKRVTVGAKDDSQVMVSFNNGLRPETSDASGDYYLAFNDVVGGATVATDVVVTIKCKDTSKPCTVQYKTAEWGCYTPPDITKPYTRVSISGDSCFEPFTCEERCAKSVSLGKKDDNQVVFATQIQSHCECPVLTATLSADGKTATNTDTNPMNVTFGDNLMTVRYNDDCAYTYKQTVYAIKFTDKCYTRTSVSPADCEQPTLCEYQCGAELAVTTLETDSVAVTPSPVANCSCDPVNGEVSDNGWLAVGGYEELAYILMANKTGMKIVRKSVTEGTCVSEYKLKALPSVLSACAKTCGDACTSKNLTTSSSVVVAKPSDKTCLAGAFAYPKALTVGGNASIVVSFNNGLTPTASDVAGDCYMEFDDIVGGEMLTAHIEATIKCKDTAKNCTVQYQVDGWGCYSPPDVTKTYTRTLATGAACAEATHCESRCAKSFSLGKLDDEIALVPQVAADCDCPVVTVMPSVDGSVASNGMDRVEVAFATNAMAITTTKDDEPCTQTYKQVTFANSFVAKTYTRQSVMPPNCVEEAECDYKCAAELMLTKPQADTIAVTPATVAGCSCSPVTGYVGDDGLIATGSDDVTTYMLTTTMASVTLTTTKAETTCVTMYAEKVVTPAPTLAPTLASTLAPTPIPTTTTPVPTTTAKTGTGTSAGVAMQGGNAGAGVCTVTLLAAAAGAQAIRLPL